MSERFQMERPTKAGIRTPSTRSGGARTPTQLAGNRLCRHCPAYPVASFRHGELVSVLIVHQCGQPAQPQPVHDWRGAVDLNELRRRHAQGQHGR